MNESRRQLINSLLVYFIKTLVKPSVGSLYSLARHSINGPVVEVTPLMHFRELRDAQNSEVIQGRRHQKVHLLIIKTQ